MFVSPLEQCCIWCSTVHSQQSKLIQYVMMTPNFFCRMGILLPTNSKLALERWMFQIEMTMFIMHMLHVSM